MAGPTDIRPPFSEETARGKVEFAEAAWNTRDSERVALAYTEDTEWRKRDASINDVKIAYQQRRIGVAG